jgi:hypothetical protein
MLTLWPFMQLGSFWERVVMPIVFRLRIPGQAGHDSEVIPITVPK